MILKNANVKFLRFVIKEKEKEKEREEENNQKTDNKYEQDWYIRKMKCFIWLTVAGQSLECRRIRKVKRFFGLVKICEQFV